MTKLPSNFELDLGGNKEKRKMLHILKSFENYQENNSLI